jgi:hypothetical protein
MNVIEELKLLKFQINWTLLCIGYRGASSVPILLNEQDISCYALEILESLDEGYELIAQLISTGNDDYEFNEILDELIKSENVDFDLQVRKWRVLLLNRQIKRLPKDCFEGLISLTELWVSLGLPDDCPNIIQGRNNSYSPKEYYTQSMFELVLKNNMKWLKMEISIIISLETKK